MLVATPAGLDRLQSLGAGADHPDQRAADGAHPDQPVPAAALARRAAARHARASRVEVLEPEKRPVAAVADHDEVRSVRAVDIRMDHTISMQMLFDPGHSLDERILREQFGY